MKMRIIIGRFSYARQVFSHDLLAQVKEKFFIGELSLS
ncbi:hypothetical protein DLM_1892 [Aquitalea magnusonii]|uniref:Uncharacterized protein n=1 Tax=Aquitalea magnusonii TaxID=332411 RepID=A0A3G9GCC5_9NEIS|nr:hypothetical protein DLM_1892 [Aquitalea magnusonii]